MSRSSTSETSEPCVILRCIFSSASFSWTLISLLARDSRIVFLCFADAALRTEMRDELSRSCLAVLPSSVEGPASMPTTARASVIVARAQGGNQLRKFQTARPTELSSPKIP